MIAVFDFIPGHCPNCGHQLNFTAKYAASDYLAKNAHTCDCGMKFQFVETKKILEIADDVHRYVEV